MGPFSVILTLSLFVLNGCSGFSGFGAAGKGDNGTRAPSTGSAEKERALEEKINIIQGLKRKGIISQEEADRRTKEAIDQALK
jgi:hypothetical protein